MSTPSRGRTFPVEEFVQSVSAQLDRAQDALALKARTGRPLTFAIKDMAIDLRVFWESDAAGRVLVRHAGPNEDGASTVHLSFTTITKSMVEENTVALSADDDPRSLDTLPGEKLDDEDRHRLEMIGVRTVGQLKRLSAQTDPGSVQTYIGVPIMRLQAALEQAARPAVTGVQPVVRGGRRALRILGANLATAESVPEVRLSGERVEVLEASPGAIVVRPLAHHQEGAIELAVDGARATAFYELPADFAAPPALRHPHPAAGLASLQDPGADRWSGGGPGAGGMGAVPSASMAASPGASMAPAPAASAAPSPVTPASGEASPNGGYGRSVAGGAADGEPGEGAGDANGREVEP